MTSDEKIGQNWPKTAKNGKNVCFTGEKWFYVIDTFFWHILAKLKKNPQNGCFAKSQKPRNDVKFGILVPFLAFYCTTRLKLKKAAMWRLSPYWAPTSYQISEKSLKRFLRYAITDGRTYARTDARDWFYRPCGFQPETNIMRHFSLNERFSRKNEKKRPCDVLYFLTQTSYQIS